MGTHQYARGTSRQERYWLPSSSIKDSLGVWGSVGIIVSLNLVACSQSRISFVHPSCVLRPHHWTNQIRKVYKSYFAYFVDLSTYFLFPRRKNSPQASSIVILLVPPKVLCFQQCESRLGLTANNETPKLTDLVVRTPSVSTPNWWYPFCLWRRNLKFWTTITLL